MSFGFTDRTDVPAPDRDRKVVVRCQLVEARVKALWIRDAAGVQAWLPRSAIIAIVGEPVPPNARPGRELELVLPEALAREKALAVLAGAGQGSLF